MRQRGKLGSGCFNRIGNLNCEGRLIRTRSSIKKGTEFRQGSLIRKGIFIEAKERLS